MKEKKCELAMGTKKNVGGGVKIMMDCGSNFLVVMDVPYKSNALLPIPIPFQVATIGMEKNYNQLFGYFEF